MATEQELSDRLDKAINDVLAEINDTPDVARFVPTHWVLIVGAQEPTGEESAVSYIPRHGQPLYVSVGLVAYQHARLDGLVQDMAPE